jgi:hypothetical protein
VIDPDGECQPTAVCEKEYLARLALQRLSDPLLKKAHFVNEMGTLAKRQTSKPRDAARVRQRIADADFQCWQFARFIGRIQPHQESDKRVIARWTSEQLLVVGPSVPWRAQRRLFHPPNGAQNDARLRAVEHHGSNPATDMLVTIRFADE